LGWVALAAANPALRFLEKIEAFLPIIDGMMPGGLVTSEKAPVLQHGTDSAKA